MVAHELHLMAGKRLSHCIAVPIGVQSDEVHRFDTDQRQMYAVQ